MASGSANTSALVALDRRFSTFSIAILPSRLVTTALKAFQKWISVNLPHAGHRGQAHRQFCHRRTCAQRRQHAGHARLDPPCRRDPQPRKRQLCDELDAKSGSPFTGTGSSI